MSLLNYLKQERIYGIIREDDHNRALETAHAYIEGGIKFIELNAPLSVTEEISKNKNIFILQGGIITSHQAQMAIEKGAKILSSPIFQQNLVRFAASHGIRLIPSVTTPNEAYNAWKARNNLIKIYPACQMGGIEYIKELMKPMPFLNILPCGFVKLEEIQGYIEAGSIAVGVGREFYSIKDYVQMVKVIKQTLKSVKYFRS